MNFDSMLTQDERREIEEKIKSIEAKAHTRIVIQVVKSHKANLFDEAVKHFSKHRLHHDKTKTGILILISVESRQFQILGDQDIHEKITEGGWNRLATSLSEFFKAEKFYEGLIALLDDLEKHLSTHFAK